MKASTAAAIALVAATASCDAARERVLIIGHRGATSDAIENSVASFRAAKELGADGVEFDVALTRDGVNVVMHDELLDRTTTCQGAVRDRTLAELTTSCALKNGEPIRTLEAMLGEVGAEHAILFVELKVFDDRAAAQADDAITQTLRSGYGAKIVLSSYDETANLRLAERQSEGFAAGWDARSESSISDAQRHGARWALLPFGALGPHSGDLGRGAGIDVCTYVVASRADFDTAYSAGVRVMMTDTIPLLRAAIDEP